MPDGSSGSVIPRVVVADVEGAVGVSPAPWLIVIRFVSPFEQLIIERRMASG